MSGQSYILKSVISLDDAEWKFQVPGLPRPQKLNEKGWVKKVSIRTDARKRRHSMILTLEKIPINRALKSHPLDHFVLVSIDQFRQLKTRQSDEVIRAEGQLQPSIWSDCTAYVTRFLREGISIQGVHYNFYGHSNSQLKSRSCFLLAGPKDEVSRTVEALGDFSKMKTVAKKAKRIGLLFSAAQVATTVPYDRVEDISDVESPDYVFTDGCGLISPGFARDLARRIRIVFRDTRYTPSVFQIRYRGYKGVVTMDPRMARGKTWLRLRKSMKKFSGGNDDSFAAVDYSKPYTYGFLNDEAIILLESVGIDRSILLRKQDEHFNLLASARTDFRAAFCFLSYINKPQLAEKVLMEGVESTQSQIKKFVNAEFGKMLNKKEEQKCRIFVRKSRLLFGVCDAWNVLKEGECAVKVTMEGNGVPYALKNTEVSVIRNPCLHPGDWQKFRAVEVAELAHLVDCIVFPTRGRRPAADMMSGGDLDGDQFFVCWDMDLIPPKLSEPALYPGVREPLRFKPITDDDRLVYFAKYTNASLGQVKNLYLGWARAIGPMSPECQELNRLFSQCVDGNRIKIPERLKTPPNPPPDAPRFILDELHSRAKESIRQHNQAAAQQDQDWDGYEPDAVELLLAHDDIAMSEFEVFKLALRWCQRNEGSIEELLHLFDFNALTAEEKAWVICRLPPSISSPSLIMNALCSSNLLNESELSQYQLDIPRVRWKRVYDSERGDRLATFLNAATKYLELFHRKLIVFRPDERLTLAIYVPQKIDRAQDCVVDDKVRLFAFPHSQGHERQSRLSLPTKMTYRLYSDDNIFQLFENARSNSWIFISRPGSNDSEYRNIADTGDRRRAKQATIDAGINFEIRASIALDKFSKGLQRHVGRVNRSKVSAAEIYIISNRDVKSMQNLDLWLEYISTGERMPLVQETVKDYTIPKLHEILSPSNNPPKFLVQILKHHKVSVVQDLEGVDGFLLVFNSLLQLDDKATLLRIFDHLLVNLHLVRCDPILALDAMVGFLRKAPFLAICFGRFPDYDKFPEELADAIRSYFPVILRAFILAANDASEFVVEPFKAMLARVPDGMMLMREFSELVRLASLTVRSVELVMDLLLACLEPESERVLSAAPEVTHHFVRNMIAIALDHVGEASEPTKKPRRYLQLRPTDKEEDGYPIIEVTFRIDAPGGTPERSSHVRFTASSLPTNVLLGKRVEIDALVTHSEQGLARFQCFHPLPLFFQDCSWDLEDCGPFVTTKTTFDAVLQFATEREQCCQVASSILGMPSSGLDLEVDLGNGWHPLEKLNDSQNAAIQAALVHSLMCLWGPPGTGKTETIVETICALQEAHKGARILVTAPTHNAVDNAMRRYIQRMKERSHTGGLRALPLRVSTEVRKVAEDLRGYTCDAMAEKEVHSDYKAMNEARKRVKESKMIFTTCIGAGVGLLRSENFEIIIIDEASQQTEAASLVPLVKGCGKVILVGDHVQLRPTVQQHAVAVGFDVSLFERLYKERGTPRDETEDTQDDVHHRTSGIQRLMLDTQYRMHPEICEFSSREFYEGRLKTGISPASRPLFASEFPWPQASSPLFISGDSPHSMIDYKRMIFIECGAKEKPGQKSKENEGQAQLCAHVCRLLTSPSSTSHDGGQRRNVTKDTQSIAVLTPYTRQADLLKRLTSGFSGIEVSSIDGFQGREADIVVFVTVRCNDHREIGFLKDLRRMNVALTRARAGLIVIGHRGTLTEGTSDPESAEMWKRLLDSLTHVVIELEDGKQGP